MDTFEIGNSVPGWARKFIGKHIELPDGTTKKCNIVAMVRNELTGESRFIPGHNIVTSNGDVWYAQCVTGASHTWTPAYFRLGWNLGAGSKGSTDIRSYIGSDPNSVDATYPKVSDGDTDNTSGGTNVVTWRCSWTTGQANVNTIAEFAICNSGTSPTIALSVAAFTAAFAKTSNDTLKVFANHVFTGS